jgi:hypothetical protein
MLSKIASLHSIPVMLVKRVSDSVCLVHAREISIVKCFNRNADDSSLTMNEKLLECRLHSVQRT